MTRADQKDLIEMQKYGWRYPELLNERDVLLSYPIITIKNNPERITNDLDMTFVHIPSGKFWMGSPDDEPERDDDETMHEVILTQGFYMQTTPVTQLQWEKVMGSNPSEFKGDPRRPVENVSWNDAKAYINKLHQRNDGHRYRLPTEAEWEYACRAGTTTPFAFGDNITPDQANYDQKKTTPVGIFEPNDWGLYDMHGNVWEWCQDCYGAYLPRSVEDPTGAESGDSRVLRGGCRGYGAGRCRSALRDRFIPDCRHGVFGFRLVLLPGQCAK